MGHDAGDAVLKTFAERIRSVVRNSDKVARLGGDEFVILLNARDSEDTARRIATSLLERIQKPIQWGNDEINITTSIGVALADRPDLTAEQVLTEADRALYEAKRAGRATFMIRKIP
jgi:diguanylate cyclase (GGDEF)-like protein